ncbi:hypothetical protein GQ457_02G034020 [Hibiscus cannabinus]
MLYREEDDEHIRNIDHLLGLVHRNWIQFPSEEDYSYLQTILFKLTQQAEEIRKHLVRKEKDRRRVRQLGEGECDFISSATELSERGIRFRQGEENCLFDIRFEHGTLFIPTLIVDHHTERIIRNLIAYEQFKDDVRSIVMDYARFIDCLINYAADVALLCDCGVINNRLGSNEDIANMINRLNDYVYLSTNNLAPRELRRVNEGAFEPQVISIGPYHHDKPHLKAMEIHKVRYLHSLLQIQQGGGGESELESYIAAYIGIEEKVRNCYAEHDGRLSPAEFGAIMILDGLFVVRLICKFTDRIFRVVDILSETEDDYLFKQNLNLSFIAQDLLLLENQLPFILLQMYADMTPDGSTFARQAFNFFSFTQPRLRMRYNRIRNAEHLLALVYRNWIQAPMVFLVNRNSSFLKYHYKLKQQAEEIRKDFGGGECDFISSATELSERGIRFRQGVGNCLFDIRFEHGTLFIPTLIVDHDTERIIRNLIAYEQFKDDDDVPSIIMDYARFIDCLINYAADVALLCDCGVIINRLGSNEDVANMINKLNNYVYLSTNNFAYSQIFDSVNERCRQPWNLWKVKLRQRYFNTPWDWVLTSIAAAVLLLILSFLQTIFSVLAYFKQGAS